MKWRFENGEEYVFKPCFTSELVKRMEVYFLLMRQGCDLIDLERKKMFVFTVNRRLTYRYEDAVCQRPFNPAAFKIPQKLQKRGDLL